MSIIDNLGSFLDENFSANGHTKTFLDELAIYRAQERTEFRTAVYNPSLCMVLRGKKEMKFKDELYSYDAEHFVISASHIPLLARVQEYPFLSFVISFDTNEILNAIKDLGVAYKPKRINKSMHFGEVSDELLESAGKLVFLLRRDEKSAKRLAKLAIKEILYTLLESDAGDFLRQFAYSGTVENQIAKAVREIKERFNESINMSEFSRNVGMSASSFYHNFKKITGLSPLEFQKRIRLEEAKFILLRNGANASQAAFDVGYESPSQFSREYAKMHGMPPKAHAMAIKSLKLS